ncbi:hypothetical protein RSAG8_09243, partial [Rhizoctonia solani AG-8 WAC10335]
MSNYTLIEPLVTRYPERRRAVVYRGTVASLNLILSPPPPSNDRASRSHAIPFAFASP